MKTINEKAIEEHIRGILEALGDDPEREGLRETPARVAQMYAEVFAGMLSGRMRACMEPSVWAGCHKKNISNPSGISSVAASQ